MSEAAQVIGQSDQMYNREHICIIKNKGAQITPDVGEHIYVNLLHTKAYKLTNLGIKPGDRAYPTLAVSTSQNLFFGRQALNPNSIVAPEWTQKLADHLFETCTILCGS